MKMSDNKQALQVAALKNGTVIDHIPSDKLFTVVALLGLQKQVLMPEELRGIVKCANPKCITNNEPMTTLFHVIDKEHGILKCHYCEKEQSKEGIKLL